MVWEETHVMALYKNSKNANSKYDTNMQYLIMLIAQYALCI